MSDARIPSLWSSRSTVIPGVSFMTTKDLIAARPSELVQRRPHHHGIAPPASGDEDLLAVEDVGSPSSRAVVWMFAESDPQPGSVIAIAAHTPSNRRNCSSDATDAIAELPSPCRGIDSSSPTSPQHISMIDSTDDRFDPFDTAFAP